jgi:hypothetical protein
MKKNDFRSVSRVLWQGKYGVRECRIASSERPLLARQWRMRLEASPDVQARRPEDSWGKPPVKMRKNAADQHQKPQAASNKGLSIFHDFLGSKRNVMKK